MQQEIIKLLKDNSKACSSPLLRPFYTMHSSLWSLAIAIYIIIK